MAASPASPHSPGTPSSPAAPRRPSGRRPGDSGTRTAILDAATALFAAQGYQATSLRSIASRAGVDPGLVRHFFTDKETLFAAATISRSDIRERIEAAFAGPQEGTGDRLARTYLGLWEDPSNAPLLQALVRSAASSPRAAELLVEVLTARTPGIAPIRGARSRVSP